MSNRPFFAARAEGFVVRRVNEVLRQAGWVEAVVPFTGYGTQTQVRVLARVMLRPRSATSPLAQAASQLLKRRGWRNFMSAPLPDSPVLVDVDGRRIEVRADAQGYVDLRVRNDAMLAPGWRTVQVRTPNSEAVEAPVRVIGPDETFGIVSDIDDTVISTSLPRLFVAAWNSLVRTEQARQPVPGMARMYRELLAEHPDSPVIYVSTGAWNTYDFLRRFLRRHGFPEGPMLLTDWGPTNTGWFRSGTEHKRRALRELARDLPQVRWLLVGDDGQHDPAIYAEFAELQPHHVGAVAIRQLTMAEQVLAHGTTTVLRDNDRVHFTPDMPREVRASDGDQLLPLVQQALADADQSVTAP